MTACPRPASTNGAIRADKQAGTEVAPGVRRGTGPRRPARATHEIYESRYGLSTMPTGASSGMLRA
jgi:hypothetical protein